MMNDYVNRLCESGAVVRIWTVNGYRMTGTMAGFGEDYILLSINGVVNMIFKHAISTIREEN